MLARIARGLGLTGRGSAPATPDQVQRPVPPAGTGAFSLVAFHCDDGKDHAGRRHETILAFSDEALHEVHDFIQWLFPLPEPSRAFHAAPVMSEADLAVLRGSRMCQERLEAARARMERFLIDNPVWLCSHDHNHLRITRIIRSTRLIAGDEAADRFRAFVLDHAEAHGARINPTTLAFWASA
jgi:hypothetical protein